MGEGLYSGSHVSAIQCLTSPPTPLLQGEGSKISPPSLALKGAGGLGFAGVLHANENRYIYQNRVPLGMASVN